MAGEKLTAKIREILEDAGVGEAGEPVTNSDVDNLGKLSDIQERVEHHRTIVSVREQQQDQGRKIYAT